MGALALLMFIGVFGFGDKLFGYDSGAGQVQLAIFLSFVLGVIIGYRTGK